MEKTITLKVTESQLQQLLLTVMERQDFMQDAQDNGNRSANLAQALDDLNDLRIQLRHCK